MPLSVPSIIRRTPPSTIAAIAFFAIALFISTFFVGDIGVYNDDHFCNQRDPVTHEAHDFVLNRPWHLWRPLTRVVLIPLVTMLWPHPWMLHAISAILHGAVVWSLYSLLKRFGVRAGIASAVALAFMLYPVHFEAVLWIDIICTLISSLIVLSIWRVYLWWLAASHHRAGRTRFLILIALGLAAWSAAALNEQPPGVLASLPLSVLICGLASAPNIRRRLVRSAMPVLAVGIGLLVYLRGYFRHIPGAARADHESAAVESLPHNLADLASKIPRELGLRNVAFGALKQGAAVMIEHPFRSVFLFGLLVACAYLWFSKRRTSVGVPHSLQSARSILMLIPLGLAWFVTAWLPVAAAHSTTSPRLHYVPCMGLAIIAASLLTLAACTLDRMRPVFRVAITSLARMSLFAGTISALLIWIGFQINYQRRYEADQAEIEPLARLFGPTVPSGTFFIPVRIRSTVSQSGSPRYDGYFAHCWTWEFAAGWNLQYAFRRNDVYTVVTYPGAGSEGLFLDDHDPTRSVMLKVRPASPVPTDFRSIMPRVEGLRTFRRVALDRCVFFEIPSIGQTQIYTKIRLHLSDSEPITIDSQPLAGTPAAMVLPEKVLDIRPMSQERREAELARIKTPRFPVTGSSQGTSSAPPPR